VRKVSAGLSVPLHPAMARALVELERVFEQKIIPDSGQGLLAHEAQWRKLADQLPDIDLEGGSSLRSLIEAAWSAKSATPEQRWRQLKSTVRGVLDSAKDRSARAGSTSRLKIADRLTLEKLVPAIVFTYTYPRLDVNVSKQRNHLLKAPFCIHPKTGRVCVLLDVDTVESFDPEAVPTLEQLIVAAGINSRSGAAKPAVVDGEKDDDDMVGAADDAAAPTELWKLTPLKPHIEAFEAYVRGCERDTRRSLRSEQEQSAAFTGAW
jgi:DNA primase small subunit